MAKPKLLIIGAGGHGQSVAEAAELNGQFELMGFVDDALAVGTLVLGYPVLGSAADLTGYASVCNRFGGHWQQRLALQFGRSAASSGPVAGDGGASKSHGVAPCPTGRRVCRHSRHFCGH